MNKYSSLLKQHWQNGIVDRLGFVFRHSREFLSTFTALTVWLVIFKDNPQAFNYSKESMVTYIFLISFLQNLIITTSLNGLAQKVYSGELSNILVKPINIFKYFIIDEVAFKLKNIIFLLIEVTILFIIFKPDLILPNTTTLIIFLVWSTLGLLLNFIITLLFGTIGFWSPDNWGPRFLFYIILTFTAGKIFPLDILPKIIQNILYLTPFPYLSFIQIQLFLARLTPQEIMQHSLALVLWIIILGKISKKVWQHGLKDYQAMGH